MNFGYKAITLDCYHYSFHHPRFLPPLSFHPKTPLRYRSSLPVLNSIGTKKSLTSLTMDVLGDVSSKELPQGMDAATEEEYASQSKLLQEFTSIPNIEKAWIFKPDNENNSQAMLTISQSNLLANKKRTHILSSHISEKSKDSVNFQWAPFPVEITGASKIVPSPSGLKLLVIRNQENESPTIFEIWGPSQLQKEIHIPKSVHGSVYADEWFEGVSWDSNETLIAYVAEEPSPAKPVFDGLGYQKGGSTKKDCGSWKGQGDWEEDWGETYAGKRQPALFVVDSNSGSVQHVRGIPKYLSVGQVIWAPTTKPVDPHLIFVGWSSNFGSRKHTRKLGIKYCYNRSCGLYMIKAPLHKSRVDVLQKDDGRAEDLVGVIKLTEGISSAFFPRFSPDGHSLVFLSAKSAVDSGAHWATNSLHKIDWPTDGIPWSATNIIDVVPVVMHAEDGCFPGLYCSSWLSEPWLSDGRTMILSSYWRSTEVILSIDVLSGNVARVSPSDSFSSWVVLALDGDNILAVCSSPIDPPQVKYGICDSSKGAAASTAWHWVDVSSPITRYSEKINSLLPPLQFNVLKIPIREAAENLTEGAKEPYEAIFVSSKSNNSACDPLIVFLHGGPHSVSLTSFSKNLAFLSSLGYSLLIINYRGSLGFGEEALQSLLGKVGFQDVNDVLKAIDHVVEMGLVDPSKIAVIGGSHGGFLTTHLIGQAPDRFVAAVARNPVCNLELMVGTTDIPDWCYVETYGTEGKTYFTESPSPDHLHHFYNNSPISHISKVKTPTLFLLGAQDLRVPVSNGLQYARALKENGVDVKVIVFPNDVHGINRPQSDYESFLNVGVWFKKYLK